MCDTAKSDSPLAHDRMSSVFVSHDSARRLIPRPGGYAGFPARAGKFSVFFLCMILCPILCATAPRPVNSPWRTVEKSYARCRFDFHRASFQPSRQRGNVRRITCAHRLGGISAHSSRFHGQASQKASARSMEAPLCDIA